MTGGLLILMASSFTSCSKPKGDQGEIKMSKNFDSEVKRLISIKAFSLADVKLEDEYFLDVTQKDVDFLNTFDVNRLLYNLRATAGLKNKASGPYNGWENTRIGGHTLGHYLAAAAQAVAGGYGDCKGKDGVTLTSVLLP